MYIRDCLIDKDHVWQTNFLFKLSIIIYFVWVWANLVVASSEVVSYYVKQSKRVTYKAHVIERFLLIMVIVIYLKFFPYVSGWGIVNLYNYFEIGCFEMNKMVNSQLTRFIIIILLFPCHLCQPEERPNLNKTVGLPWMSTMLLQRCAQQVGSLKMD